MMGGTMMIERGAIREWLLMGFRSNNKRKEMVVITMARARERCLMRLL